MSINSLPTELKCTAKKADGTLAYGVPRMLWNGKVHRWWSGPDRTAFYKLVRQQLTIILGKDMSTFPLTWVMTDAREMTGVLNEYPGDDVSDKAVLAQLKEIGLDLDAVRVGVEDLADEDDEVVTPSEPPPSS